MVHAADLLPIPWTHEALAVMAANVQRVQERLRRPIAVETRRPPELGAGRFQRTRISSPSWPGAPAATCWWM